MLHHPGILDIELSAVTGRDFKLPPCGCGDCAEWSKGTKRYLVIRKLNSPNSCVFSNSPAALLVSGTM